jgi:DNA-binding beta-propeller fold protein YncE
MDSAVTVGGEPQCVSVAPNGLKAYVSVYQSTPSAGGVVVIDLNTMTAAKTIVLGGNPAGIDVTTDGSEVGVALSIDDRVDVIDTSTDTVAGGVAIPCVASTLYDLLAIGPDHVAFPDIAASCTSYTLNQVNTASRTLGTAWNYGSFCGTGLAVSPDLSTALMTTQCSFSNTIKKVTLGSGAAVSFDVGGVSYGAAYINANEALVTTYNDIRRVNLTTGASVTLNVPNYYYSGNTSYHNVAVTPDGTRAVVTGYSYLWALDLTANTLLAEIAGGGNNVDITPDGRKALITQPAGSRVRVMRLAP